MSDVPNGPVLHQDHPTLRVIGHAAAVIGGGIVLIYAALGLYTGVLLAISHTLGAGSVTQLPGLLLSIVMLGWLMIVGLLTVLALRRWPRSLGTAAWLAVPTASILPPITIALAEQPAWLLLAVCAVIVAPVLWLMHRRNQPWEQLLSVAWVAVALGALVLLGVDV
ncbi:hypothetical protein [Longivirga aurantiaca]|uniref:Yip1 domain-containing protein n=1 Tax=Longivirga aurantiaca TaxID=1837743 RepID=A0ABW1T0A4_9ACTN